MEPRIQYAKTSDGLSIAFWTLGRGPPLVHTPFAFSHLEMEWQIPEWRRWYERLAEKHTLVRYDPRGGGLSDREITDFSPDSWLLDIESVVERLGLGEMIMLGMGLTGPTAVAYAVRHPDHVAKLILWATYARAADWYGTPAARARVGMMETDWTLYTETLAHSFLGWSAGEPARRYAAMIRETTTPAFTAMATAAIREIDVSTLLPNVRAPTLVLHRRQVPNLSVDAARQLASAIPGARLVLLEGDSLMPFMGDTEAVLTAIDEFLSDGEPAAPEAQLPTGTAVILFADIAESTALTERLGDAAFREKARALDGALRGVIRENGGTPVEGKLLGDGVLAVFTSARQAIEAALACGRAGDGAGLPLHLGLHAGDVIREEDQDGRGNVYGGAVNIAARISALSALGEVLVSDTLRGLARTSAGVSFEDRGERELKGVAEPQRLFAVRGGDP